MFNNLKAWFRRRREERRAALMFEQQIIVQFDDTGISSSYPKGGTQQIAWAQVERITIETNDSGPWGADVWWLLEGAGVRCTYPGGATGDPEALAEYGRRFPGFNHTAVIEAMGSVSNARFVCWERTAAG